MRYYFKGQRQLASYLERQEIVAERKKVIGLMRNMGLEALAPKQKTSIATRENQVYPSLLRGLEITRQAQVWCRDITYSAVRHSYLYLWAVMDWHHHFVISWRLSNCMGPPLVIGTLEDALE